MQTYPFQNTFLITFRWMGVFYFCFILYGSLIPFNFNYISHHEAFSLFFNIPFLKLGMYSRADWIANGVLYIPLSFLGCCSIAKKDKTIYLFFSFAAVFFACAVAAVGVEFLQLYFPGRTVSLNDIIAEIIGTLVGLFLFVFLRKIVNNDISNVLQITKKSTKILLIIYMVVYLLYCLFPFDFVLSTDEFKAKIQRHGSFLLNMKDNHRAVTVVWLKRAAEVLTIVPFGVAGALYLKKQLTFMTTFFWGTVIAGLIEGVQLFLVSGVTQLVSVLLKASGFCAGYIITTRAAEFDTDILRKLIENKKSFILLWTGYLILLFGSNWVNRGAIQPFSESAGLLDNLSLLPFYYQYKMSESQALFSVAAYYILYFPVGVFIGLHCIAARKLISFWQYFNAFFTGLFLAATFEFGKFFLEHARPDTTNLLIASFSSLTGLFSVVWFRSLIFQFPVSEK